MKSHISLLTLFIFTLFALQIRLPLLLFGIVFDTDTVHRPLQARRLHRETPERERGLLVLHVGPQKTASTAFQLAAEHFSEQLESELGVRRVHKNHAIRTFFLSTINTKWHELRPVDIEEGDIKRSRAVKEVLADVERCLNAGQHVLVTDELLSDNAVLLHRLFGHIYPRVVVVLERRCVSWLFSRLVQFFDAADVSPSVVDSFGSVERFLLECDGVPGADEPRFRHPFGRVCGDLGSHTAQLVQLFEGDVLRLSFDALVANGGSLFEFIFCHWWGGTRQWWGGTRRPSFCQVPSTLAAEEHAAPYTFAQYQLTAQVLSRFQAVCPNVSAPRGITPRGLLVGSGVAQALAAQNDRLPTQCTTLPKTMAACSRCWRGAAATNTTAPLLACTRSAGISAHLYNCKAVEDQEELLVGDRTQSYCFLDGERAAGDDVQSWVDELANQYCTHLLERAEAKRLREELGKRAPAIPVM